MKKLHISLILCCLPLFSAWAQPSSNIIIFSEDASLFYVYLNGVMQNQTAKSNVKITGLTNPANQLLIVFPDERKGKLTKNLYFDTMGIEATAKITWTKKGYKLRYFGEVPIGRNPNDPNQWTHSYVSSSANSAANSNTTTNTTMSTTTSTTTTTTTNTTTNTSGSSSSVPANASVPSGNATITVNNSGGSMSSGNSSSVSSNSSTQSGNATISVNSTGGSISSGNSSSVSSNSSTQSGNATITVNNSGSSTSTGNRVNPGAGTQVLSGNTINNGTNANGTATISPVTSSSVSSSAIDMNYIWTVGSSYVFQTTQTDDVNTSMMGMNMKDRFTTTSEFVVFIETVAPDGSASGWLYLIDYRVSDSRGATLASINDLPRQAVRSEFQVDRKGHFTFPKELTLITSAQGNILAYVTPNQNGVSMGGQAGDMTVDAYAEFDPKTGTLKANYKTNTIRSTRSINVKVNEETDMIDVLPYDYLELLALPDGSVAQGDQVIMRSGIYTTNVQVSSVANGNARINYTMKTDKSQDPATSNMTGGNAQSGSNFGLDTQAMGMPQMGSVDPEAAAMMNSMSPDMTCNINSDFSYAQGMFSQVSGTITTVMDAMGLKLTVVSNMTMRKL